MSKIGTFRADRHPSESYEDILNRDTRPVPAFLREGRVPDLGTAPVAASRYYDRAFFQKEADYLWPHVWQMAGREEDIPGVGDYFIYEILGRSLIVVRTAEGIKAFYNSCLHRARKLVTMNGSKTEFRCPFHGFTWNCDGSFREAPIGWDFPQWQGQNMSLPEARVGLWGGFIFINFDRSAPALESVIAPMIADFQPYELANRYKVVHVVKKVRANWKVAAEAFMESHHSLTTHPQLLPGLADANSQYDLPNDHVSRHFSAGGVASPFLPDISEDEIARYLMGAGRRNTPDAETLKLPPGVTARSYVAEATRKTLAAETGYDYTAASDAEMVDALLYNVFPNMSFWAGHPTNLVYRWRPNGLDPESSMMDVMLLKTVPQGAERPRPAQVQILELDEPWSNAPQLGSLAAVFEQDMGNMPYVQQGLHASGTGLVHFGRYSEMRIRQLHLMIDRYIAKGEADRL